MIRTGSAAWPIAERGKTSSSASVAIRMSGLQPRIVAERQTPYGQQRAERYFF
jgi:hypothetical protein